MKTLVGVAELWVTLVVSCVLGWLIAALVMEWHEHHRRGNPQISSGRKLLGIWRGFLRLLFFFLQLPKLRIVRRLLGGHWERWWVDHPVCSDVWHWVPECHVQNGNRPSAICRGRPVCEDHGRPTWSVKYLEGA